jgi:hypothetical protein
MNKKTPLALWVVPALLLAFGGFCLALIAPYHAGPHGYDQDPAYVYLFSALSFLGGQVPHHTDHPGTPLQLLGAAVVWIQWVFMNVLGRGEGGSSRTVVMQPESFLLTLSGVLLLGNALATVFVGRRIHAATQNLGAAILCQCAPLVFWVVAPRIAYLAPEALLISASMSLLGLLAPRMFPPRGHSTAGSDRLAIIAGLICGFGLAVKINFLPMFGLLFLVGARKQVIKALGAAALSFLVLILPISTRLGAFFEWATSLLIHSGRYGKGEANVMDFGSFGVRLWALLEAFTFFYVVVAALGFFLVATLLRVRINQGGRATNVRAPAIFLLVCAFQTLLVLKHPMNRYMVPVLPVALVACVWLLRQVDFGKSSQRLKDALSPALLLLAATLTLTSLPLAYANLSAGRAVQDRSLDLVEHALRGHPNPLIIVTYRCTFPECALALGWNYNRSIDIEPAFENIALFNIGTRMLSIPGKGPLDTGALSDLIAQGRAVFVLSPEYDALEVFKLTRLIKTPVQSLYRVAGFSGIP